MLDEDKKKSDIGQKLFAQGVEQVPLRENNFCGTVEAA